MKKILLIIFLTNFTSCGIETPQALPKLFTPNGVTVTAQSKNVLTVCWVGLNPEADFTGYNIYYTTSESDALALRGQRLPNLNGNSEDSTLIVPTLVPIATAFKFNVDKYQYSALQNYTGPFFVYVKAHSKTRKIESDASSFSSGTFL